MGNSVFCSIVSDGNNSDIFKIVEGEKGNLFDLEKEILPMPASIKLLSENSIDGMRDVLCAYHISKLPKAEQTEDLLKKLHGASRFSGNEQDPKSTFIQLLDIYKKSILKAYQKSTGQFFNKPIMDACDFNYTHPPTIAQVDQQAEMTYQTLLDCGYLYESMWRYDNFGCSWLPRFGEVDGEMLRFETITSAPIKGFQLFATATKFTGDVEFFEESESFWGVLVFVRGELIEMRLSDPDDFSDFYGDSDLDDLDD